jgi:mRNA interferase RelE/StbE
MPLKARRQMVARIRALATDPRPAGSLKLTGLERYRVRKETIELSTKIEDAARRVTVVKMGHRRDVHR